jgi:amino acid permease
MLSEPLAFAYAGWVCGTLLIVFYGLVTCYTCVCIDAWNAWDGLIDVGVL